MVRQWRRVLRILTEYEDNVRTPSRIPFDRTLIQDRCRNDAEPRKKRAGNRERRPSPPSILTASCRATVLLYTYVFSLSSRRLARPHPESSSTEDDTLDQFPVEVRPDIGSIRVGRHRSTHSFLQSSFVCFRFLTAETVSEILATALGRRSELRQR